MRTLQSGRSSFFLNDAMKFILKKGKAMLFPFLLKLIMPAFVIFEMKL